MSENCRKKLLKISSPDFLLNRKVNDRRGGIDWQFIPSEFASNSWKSDFPKTRFFCFWFASILKLLYLRIYGFDFIHQGLKRKAYTSRGKFEWIIYFITTSKKNLTNPKIQNSRLKLGPVDFLLNRNVGTRKVWTGTQFFCLMPVSRLWGWLFSKKNCFSVDYSPHSKKLSPKLKAWGRPSNFQ